MTTQIPCPTLETYTDTLINLDRQGYTFSHDEPEGKQYQVEINTRGDGPYLMIILGDGE